MEDMPASTSAAQLWPPLLDVTNIKMTDMLADGNTALARCVTRVIKSLDDPDGVISAFQNYAS